MKSLLSHGKVFLAKAFTLVESSSNTGLSEKEPPDRLYKACSGIVVLVLF